MKKIITLMITVLLLFSLNGLFVSGALLCGGNVKSCGWEGNCLDCTLLEGCSDGYYKSYYCLVLANDQDCKVESTVCDGVLNCCSAIGGVCQDGVCNINAGTCSDPDTGAIACTDSGIGCCQGGACAPIGCGCEDKNDESSCVNADWWCSGFVDCAAYTGNQNGCKSNNCVWTPDVVDPDDSPAACEAAVGVGYWDLGGEAYSNPNNRCCTDDANENRIYHKSWEQNDGSSKISWINLGDTVACCSNSDSQVDYLGNCHKGYVWADGDRKAVSTGFGVDDKYAVPYWSGWIDCDYASSTVTQFCNTNGNICDGGWVQAGENVGEYGANQYPSNNGYGCCGDDAGEIFVTAGVGVSKCCNSVADCVDAGGTCRSGITESTANGNCGNGIDDDCDGLTDFPNDPGCCTANEAGLCSDEIDNDCDGTADCGTALYPTADTDCGCCGTIGVECCTSGTTCFEGYCSDVDGDGNPVSPHCCETGSYWSDDFQKCVDADPCGLGGGSLCVSDISDFVSWYGDLDCYSQSSPFTGCCYDFQYNDWNYWDTSITTY